MRRKSAEIKSGSTQQALPLRGRFGWGGRRSGAGRKRGPRGRIPHEKRPALATRFPCHITLRVRDGLPSLRRRRFVRVIERSFRTSCERDRFRLLHYSVQTNHLHLVVEAYDAVALGNGMKSLAARVGRAANRVFGRSGRVLVDR